MNERAKWKVAQKHLHELCAGTFFVQQCESCQCATTHTLHRGAPECLPCATLRVRQLADALFMDTGGRMAWEREPSLEFVFCEHCGRTIDPVGDDDLPAFVCTDCAALRAGAAPQGETE